MWYNASKRRDMPMNDNDEIMKYILEEFGDVFHEWHTQKAKQFFEISSISERNWRILMLKEGLADGRKWTLRAIAGLEDVGISHVRVREICIATRKRLMDFGRSMFEAKR